MNTKLEAAVINIAEMTFKIHKKTGIDIDVIVKIVDAEINYLKDKGVIE